MAVSCTGMALCVTFDTVTGIAATRGAGAACSFEHAEATRRVRKSGTQNPSSEPSRYFDSDLTSAATVITLEQGARARDVRRRFPNITHYPAWQFWTSVQLKTRYLHRFRNRKLQATWPMYSKNIATNNATIAIEDGDFATATAGSKFRLGLTSSAGESQGTVGPPRRVRWYVAKNNTRDVVLTS